MRCLFQCSIQFFKGACLDDSAQRAQFILGRSENSVWHSKSKKDTGLDSVKLASELADKLTHMCTHSMFGSGEMTCFFFFFFETNERSLSLHRKVTDKTRQPVPAKWHVFSRTRLTLYPIENLLSKIYYSRRSLRVNSGKRKFPLKKDSFITWLMIET
jgi:hypothetical protein